MDVLGAIFAGGDLRAGVPGPADDYWYRAAGTMTAAGVSIDEESAQKISAWYRGRDILATVLAMLPFAVYRKLPNDGGAEPAPEHPLYDLLHDQPNDAQDSFQWRRAQMFDVIDYGHAYNWIVPGPRGFVDQLCPIAPTLVTPKQLFTTLPNGAVIPGRVIYDVRDARTGRTQTFTQDEIFHLRGAGGKGILEYARTSLGTALATESYAAHIFGRGTLNGGIIENPGVLDPEASKRQAESFITAAGNWALPKVLEQGSTWKPNDMSPEDFQMLLSRKFSIDDMARWLGVPRTMLENSDPSYGNAEQFDQNFLTYSMGGWTALWEFGVKSQLILKPQVFYAEFTRDAIARAKFLERAQGNVAYVNAGIYSVDEVRSHEGKNTRGGKADELREPQNITGKPAAAAEPDPSPAPPPRPPAADPSRKKKAEASEDRVRAVVTESSARVLRKETRAAEKAAVTHAANAEAFAAWATAFYADHAPLVAQTMQLHALDAQLYCDSQRDELIAQGLVVTEAWTPDYLVGLALDAPRPDLATVALLALASKPDAGVTIADGAIQLHAAPVTVNQAPVTVPVTIQRGAIQHDTHIAAPAGKTTVKKTVKRDAKNQITQVIEESE